MPRTPAPRLVPAPIPCLNGTLEKIAKARSEDGLAEERGTTLWAMVAIAISAGVVAAMNVGKLPPALPAIRAELGLGMVAGGFVVSLFNMLGMILGVFVGGIAGQLGRARVALAGIGCLAVGGVVGALTTGLPALMIGRLIEGIGFMALVVSLPAVILAASAGRDQRLALGIWSIYTPLGMSTAMLLAPLVLAAGGWRGLWWGIAALCPIVAIAFALQVRKLKLPEAPTTGFLRLARDAALTPGLQLTALIFCVYALQWMAVMVWLPTFQTEHLGIDLEWAALVTALVVFANVPGCLLGGWLIRRREAQSLLVAGSVIMGVCSLGIFLPLLPDWGRLAVSLCFSFFGGLVPPSLFNGVPRYAPTVHHVTAGNGLLMQGAAAGQFIGAPVVALAVVVSDGDWRYALVPMLAACGIALFSTALLPRVARRYPAAP